MIRCSNCGSFQVSTVWDFDESRVSHLSGWYCYECRHFERPIGREHKFEFTGKDKSKRA